MEMSVYPSNRMNDWLNDDDYTDVESILMKIPNNTMVSTWNEIT